MNWVWDLITPLIRVKPIFSDWSHPHIELNYTYHKNSIYCSFHLFMNRKWSFHGDSVKCRSGKRNYGIIHWDSYWFHCFWCFAFASLFVPPPYLSLMINSNGHELLHSLPKLKLAIELKIKERGERENPLKLFLYSEELGNSILLFSDSSASKMR